MNVIKKLGSLTFTIWLSVLLMVLLVATTSIESAYGTTFVQNTFYHTRWFDLFLSLLGINIFCAALSRFPFQKKHIGFLCTHLGILGLLLGALLTRMFGISGQMALYGGQQSNVIQAQGYVLDVTMPNGDEHVLNVRPGHNKVPFLMKSRIKAGLEVLPKAHETYKVVAAGKEGGYGPALQLWVKSRGLDIQKSFWLSEQHPDQPHPNMAMAGPIQFVLLKQQPGHAKEPMLTVISPQGRKILSMDPAHAKSGPFALGNGFSLDHLRYFAHARVMGAGKIVDQPNAGPANPAVEFDVTGPKGESFHVLKFAYFPDFEMMHGKAQASSFNWTFRFEAPQPSETMSTDQGPLVRFFPQGQKYAYELRRPDGKTIKAAVKTGQWVPLGWMGTEFRVGRVVPHADFQMEIVNAPNASDAELAANLIIQDRGKKYTQWIAPGQKTGYKSTDGKVFAFLFEERTIQLPFTLQLTAFHKKNYPGTDQPASFASDVVLNDPQAQLTMKRTISMNHPLDYKGFRVFQSSYMEDPQQGQGSVFTVARDPGVPFIYASSCFIFLGAFYQFFIRKRVERA